MISLLDARRIISEKTQPLSPVEVPLAEARGRVLAQPLLADAFYPSGDRSTMDGYAVGAGNAPGKFVVTDELSAGSIPGRPLHPGEAIRIYTGALLPAGAVQVVPQELVHRENDAVTIKAFPENRFIRKKGSEAVPGACVLSAGTVLRATELAILAQLGVVKPKVIGLPRIQHLATGDELVRPEEIPTEGKIRDTNSILLAALLEKEGVKIQSRPIADDLDLLSAAASLGGDLLLISGGASVGEYDFGQKALQKSGYTIHFDQVNLRPGKPLTFATRDTSLAFVIPGNPVSHFVCWQVAIRLALESLAGRVPSWNFLTLPVQHREILSSNPRETFWPATIHCIDGHLIATPLHWSTSGDTFSLAGVQALIHLPAHWQDDDPLHTLLLDLPNTL